MRERERERERQGRGELDRQTDRGSTLGQVIEDFDVYSGVARREKESKREKEIMSEPLNREAGKMKWS